MPTHHTLLFVALAATSLGVAAAPPGTTRSAATAPAGEAAPATITLSATTRRVVGWPHGAKPRVTVEWRRPPEYAAREFELVEVPREGFDRAYAGEGPGGVQPDLLYLLYERLERYEQGAAAGWGVRDDRRLRTGPAGEPARLDVWLSPATYGPGRYRLTAAVTVDGRVVARSEAAVEIEYHDVRYPTR